MRHGIRELSRYEGRRHYRVLPRGDDTADAVTTVLPGFVPGVPSQISKALEHGWPKHSGHHPRVSEFTHEPPSASRSNGWSFAAPAARCRIDPPRNGRHARARRGS